MSESPDRAGPRNTWKTALVLGAGFFVLYLALGLTLHLRAPRLFARLDLAFDADVPSRIIDLTRAAGAHYRTQLHPLFVLLLNPLGLGVRGLLRLLGVEPSGRLAAILLTSAAGGMAVAVFERVLRRFLPEGPGVALWSLTFGFSASQLVFAALPETFMFSALTLLVTTLVVADPARSRWEQLGASIASFGMAVSNLAAVFLVRVDSCWRRGRRTAVLAGARLALAAVATSVPLATLQLWIYPRTVPFYAVGVGREDHLSFFWPATVAAGLGRAKEVATHLALFNLAAPRLQVRGAGTEWPTVDLAAASPAAFRPAGFVHAMAWSVVLVLAASGLARRRASLPVPALALLLWLALQAALHLVFGESLFLYSCQWTFALVALVALGLDGWRGESRRRRLVVHTSLSAILALQVLGNAQFLAELVATFR